MAFSNLGMGSLDEVKNEYIRILRENGMRPVPERIKVSSSCGRVTYNAVYARVSAPHYHSCAMDGAALSSDLTAGASEQTPVYLTPEQFTFVSTGDPLPAGCDSVVMTEDIIEAPCGIELCAPVMPWQHIRQIGEDMCAGDMLLPSFTYIRPAAIGAMLASGVHEVDVCRNPIVGIIPVGRVSIPPAAGDGDVDVDEYNYAILSAMLREWGAETVTFPAVTDELTAVTESLNAALSQCDAVIINSGSSECGSTVQAVSIVGNVLCSGIAIKPGKPTLLGYRGEKPIIGIPGYPVSGIIAVEQVFRPIIELLGGYLARVSEYSEAVLSKSIISAEDYQEFVRVRVGCVDGKLIASPLSRGSGVVSSFMKADGIVEVPTGCTGYRTGAIIKVRLLKPRKQLENMLVAIGSHDPVLDELADLLKKNGSGFGLSSSHVGSMGGIMAIRRREAHLAGIHLLDEKNGDYNTSFIKKHFPKGGVRLVECVGRCQGLLVPKGNPKGIQSFYDLSQPGFRYINRQKGSGTRILCDYLCWKYGVDTEKLRGYDREEYTRLSVAAQIAAGGADAALGGYSEAQLYGLDFIHICDEQYDLLVPDQSWENPMMQALLELMTSGQFKERIMTLGGYTVGAPGSVRMRY